MSWNPEQYLKFAGPRLRPALDLLNRVEAGEPRLICDLGCGAGNVTRLLAERWPSARLIGVDSSPEMLERAKAVLPSAQWVVADLGSWQPPAPVDVIFSNAALHWLDDHRSLFRRLLGLLAPGGVLAVQMPRNFQAPSHLCMHEAAVAGPWADRLRAHLRPSPVGDPAFYWDLLAETRPDIWEIEYQHALEGEDAVVQWTLGTALKPLLDALDEPWRSGFLDEYRRRIAAAYPRRADGVTLFAFRRLFIVSRAAAAAP
ncbi:MAG TPA: methyltransferase domain-containing protein [Rhodospirillaceae bacterium]|nr:methyltransferase domain-containing protein [Rhodospirillaceae bacterium]